MTKGLLTARAKEGIEEVNMEETLLSKYAEQAAASLDTSAILQASHLGHTEYQDPERETSPIHVGKALEKNPEYTGVGRNDPCPCGSGKKYKQCHGK